MPAKKKSTQGFTNEEVAAMRERVREIRSKKRPNAADGESEVLEKIASMPPADRALAERIHKIVRATAPHLTPRTWYGMPAYSKNDQVLVYFRNASKFKTRYATLGFSDEANLDDGHVWPTEFAVTALTPADEARIAELVKRAVG
jgi:uncharacterized protein YdhG (YjbR/CyaY superfamily)